MISRIPTRWHGTVNCHIKEFKTASSCDQTRVQSGNCFVSSYTSSRRRDRCLSVVDGSYTRDASGSRGLHYLTHLINLALAGSCEPPARWGGPSPIRTALLRIRKRYCPFPLGGSSSSCIGTCTFQNLKIGNRKHAHL